MELHTRTNLELRRDRHADLMQIVMRDFRIMPQLCLTADQGGRLWTIDRESCRSLLERLVQDGFLRRGFDGRYSVPGAFRPWPARQ